MFKYTTQAHVQENTFPSISLNFFLLVFIFAKGFVNFQGETSHKTQTLTLYFGNLKKKIG